MDYIECKTFAEINIGDSATLEHTLTTKDIEIFAIMSGDINPSHVDAEFAKDDKFHEIVAHGMWGASLISNLLGTTLPGPGTIYLDQSLKFLQPIMLGDVITTTVTATSKNPSDNTIEFECKCTTQNGKVVISGQAKVIAPQTKIKRERIIMPTIKLERKGSGWNKQLMDMKGSFAPLITAVVHPVDELSIKGAVASAKQNVITPILIGPKQKIINAANEAGVDISTFEIVDTKHSHEAAEVAVQMARSGRVEALMKGKLHTDELMSAVVNKETGIRTERRMSHVFAIEVENYKKPLFLSDAALNMFPKLDDKVDIIQNTIDLFTTLGLGTPRVAIVSAVETVNEKIPSTLDAAALCKMSDRGQITGGILDGPLAFDNAISMASASIKGIHSEVAGNADIIIVPDIEAGNLLYKQMTYLSEMESAGIVMGATVPIILTSRGSDELSRLASSVLALVYARKKAEIKLNCS